MVLQTAFVASVEITECVLVLPSFLSRSFFFSLYIFVLKFFENFLHCILIISITPPTGPTSQFMPAQLCVPNVSVCFVTHYCCQYILRYVVFPGNVIDLPKVILLKDSFSLSLSRSISLSLFPSPSPLPSPPLPLSPSLSLS